MSKNNPYYFLSRELSREYGFCISMIYGILLGEYYNYSVSRPVIPENPVSITQKELAVKCGTSLGTIKKNLRKMEELGLIRQIRRDGKGSSYQIYPVR